MICPKCHTENKQGAKFCNECGTLLQEAASNIEHPSNADAHAEPSLKIASIDVSWEAAPETVSESEANAVANAVAANASETDSNVHSAEVTIDLKQLRETLPETTEESEEFSGLTQSNYEEMTLVTPWEKGATMKMKPVEAPQGSKAEQQRTFVSNENDAKPHKSKMPLVVALVVILVGAAAAFGTWYFELWGGYKVPDVVGMTQASATNVLSDKGFSVRIEQVKSDDEEGVVLLTDPQAGSRLKEGGEVVLHVAVPRTMPSIVGLSKDAAEAKLKAEGFTNITFQTQKSNETENTVLSVTPEVGDKLKAAYPITVTVAQAYQVPDVVGMSEADATAALEAEGYVVAVNHVYTEQQAEGTVLSTDPQANEKLNSGETVTISIALSRERELISVAQSTFAQGTQHSVGGINYEISSLNSVTYQGNDTTAVSVTARPYTVFLGVTMYLDPTNYTWTVSWTSNNQIASIS